MNFFTIAKLRNTTVLFVSKVRLLCFVLVLIFASQRLTHFFSQKADRSGYETFLRAFTPSFLVNALVHSKREGKPKIFNYDALKHMWVYTLITVTFFTYAFTHVLRVICFRKWLWSPSNGDGSGSCGCPCFRSHLAMHFAIRSCFAFLSCPHGQVVACFA